MDRLGTLKSQAPKNTSVYIACFTSLALFVCLFRDATGKDYYSSSSGLFSHSKTIVAVESTTADSADSHLSFGNKNFGAWSSYESWFYFGDSYTATNFNVYGEQPRVGHPFGNHGGGSWDSLYQNWPIYITSRHNASFIRSYNLAAGGSTVDRELVAPLLLGSTLVEETKRWEDHYEKGLDVEWKASTSIFSTWFGINDLVLTRSNGLDIPDLARLISSYATSIIKLYTAGARNFLIFTVPPAYRSLDLPAPLLLEIAEDMASFNSRIFEMRSNLTAHFPDAHFAVFDAHSFWARVIDSPGDFEETRGVRDSSSVCRKVENERLKKANQICQDGVPLREHLWITLHGTGVIHNATAARVVRDCLGPAGKRGFCS